MSPRSPLQTQFACFTGTKVQKLTLLTSAVISFMPLRKTSISPRSPCGYSSSIRWRRVRYGLAWKGLGFVPGSLAVAIPASLLYK